jgi:endonuclease/exonuclease/phosphatase family metal-dependent hydrolase
MSIMNKHFLHLATTIITLAYMAPAQSTQLKIATFNVSMEALNYVPQQSDKTVEASSQTLRKALESNHQQIRNIAEIIQRVNPDIILLNEFDNQENDGTNQHQSLKTFIKEYINKNQNDQSGVIYPYFYQGQVNTGVNSGVDLDGNGKKGELPGDGFGYGHFSGHFGMALLSKYPIDEAKIRTFQLFKWRDMPNAQQPIDPETSKPWFSKEAWQSMRLSSKSHWDIPVEVNGKIIHILASHPTPPIFDGPEDRNGKRNHDEIRFWADYISTEKSEYIYDDKGSMGGMKSDQPFVILGDLNASNVDGDAMHSGISSLLNNKKIQDAMPKSKGAKLHTPENINALHHTAFWRMRADYVLPSVLGFKIANSGVFWPTEKESTFRLIKDRSASSDHRMVWLDLTLNKSNNDKIIPNINN